MSTGPIESKRKRWTKEEEEYLFNLARAKVTIIDSKQSDKMSNSNKSNAWDEIRTLVNTKFDQNFTSHQCQEKWKAHKKLVKEAAASERRQSFRTGNIRDESDVIMDESQTQTYSAIQSQIDPIKGINDSDQPKNSEPVLHDPKRTKILESNVTNIMDLKLIEHKNRMDLMQKEHELSMRLKKEESDLRIKNEKEYHAARMLQFQTSTPDIQGYQNFLM